MGIFNAKVNRNTKRRLALSGATGYALDNNETIQESFVIDTVSDNFFISTPIPGSDHQYSWITASILVDDREKFPYSYATSSTDLVFVSSSVWFDGNYENYLSPVGSPNIGSFDPNTTSGITTSPAYYDVDTGSYTVSLVGDGSTINKDMQRKYVVVLNGPYQYPTWKQIRPQDHPVWRSLSKESFLLVQKPAPSIYNGYKQVKARRNQDQDYYHIPYITKRYNRMRLAFEELEKFTSTEIVKPTYIEFDYASLLSYFPTNVIDSQLNVPKKRSLVFDAIYQNYNNNLNSNIGDFISVVYTEVVWPKEENTFLQRTRDRQVFSFNWNDDRNERTTNSFTTTFNDAATSASVWPLDARPDYDTEYLVTTASTVFKGNVGELCGVTNYFHNGDTTRLTASACFTYPFWASSSYGQFITNDTKFTI